MVKFQLTFGYSVQKTTYGMRDQIQVEAVSNQSGDVPNQTGAILETLPEAPDIETKAVEIVSEKIEKNPTGSQN